MIYFITDGTYTKVGKSTNPSKRIKTLQTSNPLPLTFTYIFDVKDSYEKQLHKLLSFYYTSTKREWFNLKECNLKGILENMNHPAFKDLDQAEFKARRANIDFYRGDTFTSENRSEVLNKVQYLKSKKSKLSHKDNIKALLNDISFHLENYPNKRIYYDPYIIKYGFSKGEISAFVKKARLSKLVFQHNEKL